jgi:hypothetical protein
MRHLLAVCGLRQLLGDDTGQCAENSFSKLYREGHPELLRLGMTVYLLAARGGTTVVREWSMTTLLAEFSAGDPDATWAAPHFLVHLKWEFIKRSNII